jgi:hypothetical protein
MKRSISLIICLIVVIIGNAQTQGSAYTAIGKGVATTFLTDYQCLGINTSALGWGTGYKNKKFTMGTSEFGFGIYSDALNNDKLKNLSKAIQHSVFGSDKENFDWTKQRDAAADYALAGISIFADYNWGGFSFQGKKFGGIAFSVRENYQWYSKLSQQATDIVFKGKLSNYFDSLQVVFNGDTSTIANGSNISADTLAAAIQGTVAIPLHLSEITNGSSVKMLWTRSYNFGYGRKIIGKDSVFVLYGGIGGRFIQSMAMFDLQSNHAGMFLTSSLSPAFNVNYGAVAAGNLSAYTNYSGGLPPAVGNGYGIDLSASLIFMNKLKVAMAINNIGSVTYDRNVYSVKDTLLASISLAGLSSGNITQSINQLLRDGGLLTLVGKEKYTVTNAANFRLGASFHPFRMLSVGLDVVAPFNRDNPGSIQNPVFSVGGDIKPFRWLQLSMGYFGGGIYKSNIPMGVNFILRGGAYEFGVSSRDAVSFFTKNKHSLSGAFGFARFRF